MSTQAWSSRVRHDSDDTYQEWRDEFITKLGLLVTAGVLAADETNITPAAGSRPATNTGTDYAVFHINDSLHGTAPIYLKFMFGTNSTATMPRIQVETGTATNGSGTLSGTAKIANVNMTYNSGTAQTGDTARNSYLCCEEGFFGINWKVGKTTSPEGLFLICRTCDADGVPDARGALTIVGNSAGQTVTSQALRFAATAAAYTQKNNADTCYFPQRFNGAIGADIRIGVAWSVIPQAVPMFGICGIRGTDMTEGSQVSATLVGSTPRNYIRLSTAWDAAAAVDDGSCYFGMLWE
jgi:hypothetical protein